MTPTRWAQKLFQRWDRSRTYDLRSSGEVSDGTMHAQLAAFEAVEAAIRDAVAEEREACAMLAECGACKDDARCEGCAIAYLLRGAT